jgi:hypothetical protein
MGDGGSKLWWLDVGGGCVLDEAGQTVSIKPFGVLVVGEDDFP